MKARKERVQDIYTEIVEACGYWPCISQLSRYMGIDDAKVKQHLQGVPMIRDGRRYKYRAKAVAERLADMEAR